MYIIANYAELYNPTNSKGGELKNASFVKMPVKPRGKGLRALLRHENGIEIFGIWSLLLQAATETTSPELRGKFLNHKDEPASIEEIADAISLENNVDLVKKALALLISLRWIDFVQDTDSVRTDPVPDADEVPPKVKISKDNLSKDKKSTLDFIPARDFDFKNLLFVEFGPVTKFEENTLAKIAKKCSTLHKTLKNHHKYIIDIIRDIKLKCKTDKIDRTGAIKMFVARITKEQK